MSKAVSVRNSAGSNEKFSSKKREENGCSLKVSAKKNFVDTLYRFAA